MVEENVVKFTINLKRATIERAGKQYFKIKSKKPELFNESIEEIEKLEAAGNVVDVNFLRSLDPKNWKDQDHYAVLGLEKQRFFASDNDIKRAHRSMVLLHHPDKRKAKGEKVDTDNDYFTCITKAYEVLGTSKTRRAFDSVDPEFDDALPLPKEIEKDFYGTFKKCFSQNARWSEENNVPSFGDENSTRKEVEHFYNFWYDFKSWREYSYLDEEDKEKGQDRDERRFIEKENKAARIKRKKKEMARIRSLVDLAYQNDKRIQRFKTEEKERKLAAKRAKAEALQAQKAEEERVLKESQQSKDQDEKDGAKKAEEIRMKKALKKERKLFRDKAKEHLYFSEVEKQMLKNMEYVEIICENFELNDLQDLNREIDKDGIEAFKEGVKKALQKRNGDKEDSASIDASKDLKAKEQEMKRKDDLWTKENLQLLIKAFNLFPPGTIKRYDVIATYMNQHSTNGLQIVSRDVINKAKALKNTDFKNNDLQMQENESAFENFEKSRKAVQITDDITVAKTDEMPNGLVKNNENSQNTENITQKKSNGKTTIKAWTTEEQALLEQALKTYPATIPDRWDRIAECVPNRSKKDCLRRVKELVELVNAKKEAKQAVK